MLSGVDEWQLDSPEQRAASSAVSGDTDLRALLQALLTWADLEAMVAWVEEVHHRDLKLVQSEVQQLTDS